MFTDPTTVTPLVIPKVRISIVLDQSIMPPRITCDVDPPNSLTQTQLIAILSQVIGTYAQDAMKYEVGLANELIGLRALLTKKNGGA